MRHKLMIPKSVGFKKIIESIKAKNDLKDTDEAIRFMLKKINQKERYCNSKSFFSFFDLVRGLPVCSESSIVINADAAMMANLESIIKKSNLSVETSNDALILAIAYYRNME